MATLPPLRGNSKMRLNVGPLTAEQIKAPLSLSLDNKVLLGSTASRVDLTAQLCLTTPSHLEVAFLTGSWGPQLTANTP